MPRRYGQKVTLREICYEILYQNYGQPMHVEDMVHKAKQLKLFEAAGMEAPTGNVKNTMASKMNQEIQSEDSRFVRTGENTFALATGPFSQSNTPAYSGRFRDLVTRQKDERRTAAVAAGEINDKKSEIPEVSRVTLPKLKKAGAAVATKWPALSAEEEELVSRIESLITEKRGFEWRLRASAALRAHTVEKAKGFLELL